MVVNLYESFDELIIFNFRWFFTKSFPIVNLKSNKYIVLVDIYHSHHLLIPCKFSIRCSFINFGERFSLIDLLRFFEFWLPKYFSLMKVIH